TAAKTACKIIYDRIFNCVSPQRFSLASAKLSSGNFQSRADGNFIARQIVRGTKRADGNAVGFGDARERVAGFDEVSCRNRGRLAKSWRHARFLDTGHRLRHDALGGTEHRNQSSLTG